MKLLSDCDLGQFLDHVVPFLRNISGFHYGERKRSLLAMFDEIWHRPPDESPSRIDRKLGMEFPASVMLEITQSCNFACRMCSSRTGGFLAHRTMPVEAFDEFVRVFAPYAKVLRINGYGETSIVPGLASYLDCLDHHHYSESREIITNFSANDAVYLDLHARGFTQLVSWDAASQAVFEHIRVGACYDELLPRLRKLGKAVRPHPERLGLLMTVQERNLPQVVPVTRLAVEVGAGLVIFNMIKEEKGSPWMEKRFQEIRRIFSEVQSMAAAAGLIVSIPDHVGSQRLRTPQVKRTSGSFCDRPWRELFIRYDGEAQVCNMFNPFSYGQLTPPGAKQGVEQRFHILWSGPNARLFRRLINSEHPHPYCKECYYLYG
jgi:MoaA/NifB/PqqE/SkfB family radical SAM enzyme